MKDKFNSANMKEFLVQNAIYFVLGALLVGIIIKEPTFLSLTNFTNILSQSLPDLPDELKGFSDLL